MFVSNQSIVPQCDLCWRLRYQVQEFVGLMVCVRGGLDGLMGEVDELSVNTEVVVILFNPIFIVKS